MLNVRLAGDLLYGKSLFTWLSLVMSLMVSFYAILSPTRYLGSDQDLIGSVSEGFPTYSYLQLVLCRVTAVKCLPVHLHGAD